MTVYLYDTQGTWIAFRPDAQSHDLFNAEGDWIGWFPWGDDDAVTPDGAYLGTVIGDRLLAEEAHPFRGTPPYPGAPAYPGRASYPGIAPFASIPPGFDDVPSAYLWPRFA